MNRFQLFTIYVLAVLLMSYPFYTSAAIPLSVSIDSTSVIFPQQEEEHEHKSIRKDKGIFAFASLIASSLGLGIIFKSFFLVTPNLLWSCIGGSLILAGLLLGYIGKKKGRKYSKLATIGYEIAFGVIATAIIIALVIVAAILVFLAFPRII